MGYEVKISLLNSLFMMHFLFSKIMLTRNQKLFLIFSITENTFEFLGMF